MKKIVISIMICILVLPAISAQDETDALRYSQNFLGGTARSVAMGGAFGALGGDFSSLSLNPAGIGVYRSTEISFTPVLFFNSTSTKYLDEITDEESSKMNVSNLGFVSTRLTGAESGWVSWSFGVGFNRINDFERSTFMDGYMIDAVEGNSSLLDNFTNRANAGEWSTHYEQVAFDAYGIDTLPGGVEYYNLLLEGGHTQYQSRRIRESGGSAEYLFSIGGNYSNKLYVGASFGITRVGYTYRIDHYEEDDAGIIDDFGSFDFSETIRNFSTGYTLKAGLIYRPVSVLRLGAAVHLPTFYRMREEWETEMESHFDNRDYYQALSPINEFDFRLRTPMKFIGSVAFQLPRLATFSFDYELVDYSGSHYDSRPTDEELLKMNDRIEGVFRVTHNLRAGAEVKLGNFYMRGGYAHYASPYRDGHVNHIMNYDILSGGIGFRLENVSFDFAYSLRNSRYLHYLYVPENLNMANTIENKSQIMATVGFRF